MNFKLLRRMIVCACVFLSAGAFADGTPLFKAQLPANREVTSFQPDEIKRIAMHRDIPNVRSVSVVSIEKNAIFSNVISVTLPTGEVLTFIKTGDETIKSGLLDEKERAKAPESYHWYGKTTNNIYLNVAISGANVVSGGISGRGLRWNIHRLNDQYQLLVNTDMSVPFTQDATPAASGVGK